MNMKNIENEIRQEVMNTIDLSVDVSDDEILKLIRNKIIEKRKTCPMNLSERKRVEGKEDGKFLGIRASIV